MRRFAVVAIVTGLAGCGLQQETRTAGAALSAAQCGYFAHGGKVKVCHATGSATNPIVVITPSVQGCINGHADHAGDTIAVDGNCGPDACLPVEAPCDSTLRCCDGLACNGGTCHDIDACVSHPCGANAACTDKPAPAPDSADGRSCACNSGFTADPVTGACVAACSAAPRCQSATSTSSVYLIPAFEFFPGTGYDTPFTHSFANANGTVTRTAGGGCEISVDGLTGGTPFVVYVDLNGGARGDISTAGGWRQLGSFVADSCGHGAFTCPISIASDQSIYINNSGGTMLISDNLGATSSTRSTSGVCAGALQCVPATATWSAAADFSATSNPACSWSYGWSQDRASAFNLYPVHANIDLGLQAWRRSQSGEPLVYYNQTSVMQHPYGTISIAPGQLAFHPGPSGENSVIRWTAPRDGIYDLNAVFTGISGWGGAPLTTTDVSIYIGSTEVFSGLLNLGGHGNSASFAAQFALTQGQTIDFRVGFGAGSYYYDSTALAVEIHSL